MKLKENYNKMVSDFLFEEIAKKYDIVILIRMHIDHPFFEYKNQAMEEIRKSV